MERNYKLYVHIAPNGKRYYGITGQKSVKQRWQCGRGYSNNQYFANAINKYGWENIEHIILHEGLDEDEAKELEQYMIQWYDTANRAYGYNISLGGDGSNHSEETKQKISESHKGIYHTEEAKKKMSKAKKGKYIGTKNPRARNVICITTNRVFATIIDGANCYNINRRLISACCRGKQKSSGKLPDGTKLVWKYIDIIEL